jgi:SAM-dependent methyltransferase
MATDVGKRQNSAMKRYQAIAEYYDAEYANLQMLKHDVPFFLGQLPRKRQSVLELAVGTARAAIPIAQAGHRVVGVDYARDLLAIAKRKRGAAGLKDRELSLLYRDVRKLDLGRTFDWVTIFFNTFLAFPTLAEQDRVLAVARRHLKPRGRFWLDIFQPDLQILAGSQKKGFEPGCFFVPQLNRTVYQTTDIRRDLARQVQDVTFNYSWFDQFGVVHTERNRFTMTWIFPRELQMLLERNGLKIEKLWGNYDGSALNSASPRIIARCVRD